MTGFLIFLLGILSIPLVPFYAIKGKYPDWMVTPDDPTSPFGQYEPTVRKVYDRFGRFVGDTYWLAFRNRLYGLSYRLKPDFLKGITDYRGLRTVRLKTKKRQIIYLQGMDRFYKETELYIGKLVIIYGYKLSPIHNDKHIPRKEINMDGRPTFSIRFKEPQ